MKMIVQLLKASLFACAVLWIAKLCGVEMTWTAVLMPMLIGGICLFGLILTVIALGTSGYEDKRMSKKAREWLNTILEE